MPTSQIRTRCQGSLTRERSLSLCWMASHLECMSVHFFMGYLKLSQETGWQYVAQNNAVGHIFFRLHVIDGARHTARLLTRQPRDALRSTGLVSLGGIEGRLLARQAIKYFRSTTNCQLSPSFINLFVHSSNPANTASVELIPSQLAPNSSFLHRSLCPLSAKNVWN